MLLFKNCMPYLRLQIITAFATFASIINNGSIAYNQEDNIAPHKFHNWVVTESGNPWISGPNDKRYQFRVGHQSWVSARESCLAQNADLVTIHNSEELSWILDHYKPRLLHGKDERQIQIGLITDYTTKSDKPNRWLWVDDTPVNKQIINWTDQIDDTSDKRQCTLLNINESQAQDIDCEFSGFYRFICERNGEKHAKHEMLTNPLLKKLSDILDFFGVSSPSTASSSPSINKENSTEDYFDITDSNKSSDKIVTITNGLSTTENSAINFSSINTDVISSDTITGTTVKNFVNKVENLKSTKDSSLTIISNKTPSKITKLHSAGKLLKINSNHSLSEISYDKNQFHLSNNKLTEPEGLVGIPEPIITNDAIPLKDSVPKTTRADTLEKLADTLEYSFLSSHDANISVVSNKLDNSQTSNNNTIAKRRIHTLERIIFAVQKMIDNPELISNSIDNSNKPNEQLNTIDNKTNFDSLLNISSDPSKINIDNLGLKIEADNADIASNLEEDFIVAHKETRVHPNINSGDFVIRSNTNVIGACGDTSNTEKVEESNIKFDKPNNVREFVHALHKYIESNEDSELKEILNEHNSKNKTLLERLEELANSKQRKKNEKQGKINSNDKDPENPVAALITLYEKKFHKEKQAKIDAQIFAELAQLREIESQEGEFSDGSDEETESELLTSFKDESSVIDEKVTSGKSRNEEDNDEVNSVLNINTNQSLDLAKLTNKVNKQNDSVAINPTSELVEVMSRNPTQDLIDAILTIHDNFQALLSSKTQTIGSENLNASKKVDSNTHKQIKIKKFDVKNGKENDTHVKAYDNIETFPLPNINSLSYTKLKELIDSAEKNEVNQKKLVEDAYKNFTATAIPIDELAMRIQSAEINIEKKSEENNQKY